MQNITEVNSATIRSAEFVKLTIYNEFGNPSNTTVYTFSNSYKNEVIDGVTYLALGGLLGVGSQPKDLRVTSAGTSLSLVGVSGNNIAMVLATNVKGSEVQILRGFYNDQMVLGNVYPRFTGIVTSYAITEEVVTGLEDVVDNFVVTITASSYREILENRTAGRTTTQSSWQFFNATDSSMNNVASLAQQQFDFGKDPKTVGQAYGGNTVPTFEKMPNQN